MDTIDETKDNRTMDATSDKEHNRLMKKAQRMKKYRIASQIKAAKLKVITLERIAKEMNVAFD